MTVHSLSGVPSGLGPVTLTWVRTQPRRTHACACEPRRTHAAPPPPRALRRALRLAPQVRDAHLQYTRPVDAVAPADAVGAAVVTWEQRLSLVATLFAPAGQTVYEAKVRRSATPGGRGRTARSGAFARGGTQHDLRRVFRRNTR